MKKFRVIIGTILFIFVGIIVYESISYSPVKTEFIQKKEKLVNNQYSTNKEVFLREELDNYPQALKKYFGMATLFLTKIIRCCECCGVMAPIALDNEHPRI